MYDVVGFKRRDYVLCTSCAVELSEALGIALADGDVYNSPEFAPVFASDAYAKRHTCADCGTHLLRIGKHHHAA